MWQGTFWKERLEILQRRMPKPCQQRKQKKEFWSEDKHIYEITRDLKRNRSIMKSTGAFLDQTKIVSKGWMLDKGYNFEYYTNILHTKKVITFSALNLAI
jgi:hypothetical protein